MLDTHNHTLLEVQKYIFPEVADEVEALIEHLDLDFFGKVERIEEEEDLLP